MNFNELQTNKEFILLDCISGSHAYNLNHPESDVDRKGIFILPQKELYGFYFPDQLNNTTNDEVYFEIRRFLELLLKNNPNILELLSTPKQFINFRHPLMDLICPADFLSKLCVDTFAGYAQSQIKKAKGLNKKINQPIAKVKKTVLDFCYAIDNAGSIPLLMWLDKNGYKQEDCGLVSIDHFRNDYFIYHNSQLQTGWLKGIVSGYKTNDVQLSSVPKSIKPITIVTFNKDAYSVYSREYRDYKEWEENRNDLRYESTLLHGKQYDAKNMMHTFRLLNMAEEIALYKQVVIYRDDREFLLSIRSGAFEFETLIDMVDEKLERIKSLFALSDLPEEPNAKIADNILLQIREHFYK